MQITNLKLKFIGNAVMLITTFGNGKVVGQVLSYKYEPSQCDMWVDAIIAKILEGKFK